MALNQRLHENRYLLSALLTLLVLSNVPYGQYILYPFELFSTWIHELCHGLAGLAVGGKFKALYVYADTSGRALTSFIPGAINNTIVSSAGYIGTTLFGALLLLLLRPTRFAKGTALLASFALLIVMLWKVNSLVGSILFLGIIGIIGVLSFLTPAKDIGKIGTASFGVLMLLSLIYIRNIFGLAFVGVGGLAFLYIGTRGSREVGHFLFSFLAATCGLNALTSIKVLFSANTMVNGQPSATDAHAVASTLFGPPTLWATLWMAFSVAILGGALYRSISAPTVHIDILDDPDTPNTTPPPPTTPAASTPS